MSAISEKVRLALFAKSNVSTLVDPEDSQKLTAIYHNKARANGLFPYGVIQRQAPGPVDYSFGTTGPTQVMEGDLWTLKVLVDSEMTDGDISAEALAEQLSNAWCTLLGHTLILTGNTVAWMARFADMPPFEEKQGDRFILHRGFLLRIKVV